MRIERVSNCCGSRGSLTTVDFQPHANPRNVHRLATTSTTEVQIWALWRPESKGEQNEPFKCVCLFTFRGHSPYEVSVARWSPNGRYLASADTGGVMYVLEKNEEKTCSLEKSLQQILEGKAKVSDVTDLQEPQPAVIKETKKYTFKYDGTAGTKGKITLEPTENQPAPPKGTRISFESQTVQQEVVKQTTTENSGGNFEIWTPLQPIHCSAKMGQLFDISWAPDNRSIVGGGLNGQVAVYDIHTKQVVAKFDVFEGIHPDNAFNVRGYVKSVAWDPMSLYIAVQTNNRQVSVWRRSPPHLKPAPYKWTFKRVLYDEELFEKTQNDVLGGCRISWTPNGQAISFPNGGVGNVNFAACFEVMHADISRQSPRQTDGKLDTSRLQFIYDVADHSVRPDPLLLCGHNSRVRNARFSQDLLVSYKRGLCKGSTLTDSDRFIFYAQTSDDGMISIWRFKQSSNWYSHYKNEAQCICVLQKLTDEQSSIEDISWGNSGKWLAIATSQGGLILIEMIEEETSTRYLSNWMLGVGLDDKNNLDHKYLDKLDKYAKERMEEEARKEQEAFYEALYDGYSESLDKGVTDPYPLNIYKNTTGTVSSLVTSTVVTKAQERMGSHPGFIAGKWPDTQSAMTPNENMRLMVMSVVLWMVQQTTYCLCAFVHASVEHFFKSTVKYNTRLHCRFQDLRLPHPRKLEQAGVPVPIGLHTDALTHHFIESGGESICTFARNDIDVGLFEDMTELPYSCPKRRRTMGSWSIVVPQQYPGSLEPTPFTATIGTEQVVPGLTAALESSPEGHCATFFDTPHKELTQSQEPSNDLYLENVMSTPDTSLGKKEQLPRSSDTPKKQSKKPKRAKNWLIQGETNMDIWLQMDYSHVEELLIDYWKNCGEGEATPKRIRATGIELAKQCSSRDRGQPSHKSEKSDIIFKALPKADDTPKPTPAPVEPPKTTFKKKNRPELSVPQVSSEKERRSTQLTNVFTPPYVQPVICTMIQSTEAILQLFILNNLKNDLPTTVSCMDSDNSNGFSIKWTKSIEKGYVTHVCQLKTLGMVLVLSQVGELLRQQEEPISLKRKRWYEERNPLDKQGEKGISKRYINQDRASILTVIDIRTGKTVMEPVELPNLCVSSLHSFCSGGSVYIVLASSNNEILLYSLDGTMERRSLRLIFETSIATFLPREKYEDILQIQMLNVTLNASTDAKLQGSSKPLGETHSHKAGLAAENMLNGIPFSWRKEEDHTGTLGNAYLETTDIASETKPMDPLLATSTPERATEDPQRGTSFLLSSDKGSRPHPIVPLDNSITLDSEPDNNMYALVFYLRDSEVYVVTKRYTPVKLELGNGHCDQKTRRAPKGMLSLRYIREIYKIRANEGTSLPSLEQGSLFSSMVSRLVDLLQLNQLAAETGTTDNGDPWKGEIAEKRRLMESALIIGSRSEYSVYLYEYVQLAFETADIDEITEAVTTLYKTLIDGSIKGWESHRVKLSALDSRMMYAIGIDVESVIYQYILPLLHSLYDVICQECGRRKLYIVNDAPAKDQSGDSQGTCHAFCRGKCPITEAEKLVTDEKLVDENRIVKMYQVNYLYKFFTLVQTCGGLLKRIGFWAKIASLN